MILKLAWRNLWRNSRRTIITATSIMFAVVLATSMRCLQLGSYDKMIENVVTYYSGYIQVQGKKYWENKSIDEGFIFSDSLNHIIRKTQGVVNLVPRIESYVLASSPSKTKGALVVGTDPVKEDSVTHLSDRIVAGHYFEKSQSQALISEGLGKSLVLGVGDTLVLLGQGYHGANAAGKYPICGIVKFGSPELNKGMICLPMKQAQSLFGGKVVTSIALIINSPKNLENVKGRLRTELNNNYVLKDWKEMMPDLVQAIQADNSGGLIMAGVLYLIITFGLFGTLIMMLAERQHEFGVLVSIGMKRFKTALMVLTESIMIGVLGTITGFMLSIPVVLWFYYHPIHFTGDVAKAFENYGFEPIFAVSIDPTIFLAQAELVFALAVCLSLYPFFKLLKLNALEAMRH